MSQKTAAVALIFGIIGMGLAGYMFYENKFLPGPEAPTEGSIKNTWYTNKTGMFGIQLNIGSVGYLANLSISASVNSGENIYVLFTAYLRLWPAVSEAFFYIYMDGVDVSYHTRIDRIDTSIDQRFSVSLQWGSTTITAGTHNVSVWGYADGQAYIYTCGLLVQTFI